MGTVVDVTIPTEQFALSEAFDTVPDAEFETVRVAAHGPSGVMPFLWASAPESERLDDALRADETTEQVTRLSSDEEKTLYRIGWRANVRVVIGVFVEADGSLLGAQGRDDRWELRVLFPDRQSVSTTYESWRNHGIDPSIRRVHNVSEMMSHGGSDLSPCQHEALVEAFETDYYDVPRGVTLDNLAEKLDVSHQALSERLRRGHRNLVRTTLCDSSNSIQQ